MNILAVKHGIIVHQINCQGVMGCVIELQIRQKWPEVYQHYKAFARAAPIIKWMIGKQLEFIVKYCRRRGWQIKEVI